MSSIEKSVKKPYNIKLNKVEGKKHFFFRSSDLEFQPGPMLLALDHLVVKKDYLPTYKKGNFQDKELIKF